MRIVFSFFSRPFLSLYRGWVGQVQIKCSTTSGGGWVGRMDDINYVTDPSSQITTGWGAAASAASAVAAADLNEYFTRKPEKYGLHRTKPQTEVFSRSRSL